jgi:hypothetical protein
VHSWNILVHGWATNKHKLTKLTTTLTWGKPPPSSLQYILCLATGPAPKCHFVLGPPSGSPEIPINGILTTLGAHNFVWKPTIDKRFWAKLYLSSRSFQWYVARHLNARKSRWFLTFSGFGFWVGSQIGNLTPGFSFGHNLCLKCPNGSCKPILNIYVPRNFQWYKENFNLLGFDLCNFFIKIQESTETPTPKVGAPLGVWRFIPSHSHTLLGTWNVTLGLPSWPTPLQALPLVANPRLGLR